MLRLLNIWKLDSPCPGAPSFVELRALGYGLVSFHPTELVLATEVKGIG
jgi:hypothetical protein